jgi:hypothetical protein
MEKQTYNIDVRVRIRPVLQRELYNNTYTQCLAVKDNLIYISKENKAMILQNTDSIENIAKFSFNQIYDQQSTQDDIFKTVGVKSIKSALDGYNTTIFAYGQTGSGKTYTIEGGSDSPGLFPKLLGYLFQEREKKDLTVKMTVLQIYLETMTDLLNDCSKHPITIKKADNGYDCKHLSEHEVNSVEEAMKLFNRAQNRRIIQSTNMNDTSSRSHVIYTLKIIKGYKNVVYSKFNLVDLAGSERISKSGTTCVNLKESISINKSLYSLQGVVDALTNCNSPLKKNPPFKDSKLTMILKDSLGGNCITFLIANISPSLTECSESMSTLKFAAACRLIKNEPRKNQTELKNDAKLRLYGKEKKPEKKTEKVLPWKEHQFEYFYNYVDTSFGKIAYIQTTCKNPQYTMILLHANPSDSTEFIHWFQALSYYNIRVIAIDQPGFGRTKGKPFACNSVHNLEKGGPCDVVISVIKALDIKEKIVIGGYDWGAGIAISLCTRYKIFDKLIAFLPSYAEPTGNELKCISIPALIIWMDQDQFHLWSKWKALAEKIPKKTVEIIKMKHYKVEHAGDCYEHYSDKIMRPVVMHFGIPDPLIDKEELANSVIKDGKDTKGNSITAKVNLNFLEDINLEQLDKVEPGLKYVMKFKQLYAELGDKIYELYNTDNSVSNLFTGLPTISPDVLEANPTLLVQLGIWRDLPANINTMWTGAKYFTGRKVLIFIPCSGIANTKDFLIYNPEAQEKFLSPFGSIKEVGDDFYTVETIGIDNKLYLLKFPKDEIHLYNSGQIFYKDNLNRIELEDSIKANYDNPLVKAKLIEICIKLAPLIDKMDYNCDSIVNYQKLAIVLIRKCLNVTSFYKGVDRERHGRTDCIGKLAVNGQAQCHGLSSTISGYLLPFCSILGLELLYRGGYSYVNERDSIPVSNLIEKHQWLQVNLRPSMCSFVVDVWYQEQFNDDRFLMMELVENIRKGVYPHPKLLLKNKIIVD